MQAVKQVRALGVNEKVYLCFYTQLCPLLCMRNISLIVIGVAITSLILVAATSTPIVFGQKEKYNAKLSGKNEIPPVDSSAKGSASFKSKEDRLTWKINITGLANATGLQLYIGNKSENGNPVVDLMKLSNKSQTQLGIVMNGNISASDLQGSMQGKKIEDLKSAMSSGGTYLNILTSDHPQGEMRGQIKLRATANQTAGTNATQTVNMTQSG